LEHVEPALPGDLRLDVLLELRPEVRTPRALLAVPDPVPRLRVEEALQHVALAQVTRVLRLLRRRFLHLALVADREDLVQAPGERLRLLERSAELLVAVVAEVGELVLVALREVVKVAVELGEPLGEPVELSVADVASAVIVLELVRRLVREDALVDHLP